MVRQRLDESQHHGLVVLALKMMFLDKVVEVHENHVSPFSNLLTKRRFAAGLGSDQECCLRSENSFKLIVNDLGVLVSVDSSDFSKLSIVVEHRGGVIDVVGQSLLDDFFSVIWTFACLASKR